MNMNEKFWSKLSSIAEIVSSIAILITLIFLVVEMRQNTEALNAQSRQQILQSAQTQLLFSATNPEMAKSIIKPGPLTQDESVLLGDWLTSSMRFREYSWLQYRSGVIDENQWNTELLVIEIVLSAQKPRQWWSLVGREQVNPEFAVFVDELLEQNPVNDEYWQLALDWGAQ